MKTPRVLTGAVQPASLCSPDMECEMLTVTGLDGKPHLQWFLLMAKCTFPRLPGLEVRAVCMCRWSKAN